MKIENTRNLLSVHDSLHIKAPIAANALDFAAKRNCADPEKNMHRVGNVFVNVALSYDNHRASRCNNEGKCHGN